MLCISVCLFNLLIHLFHYNTISKLLAHINPMDYQAKSKDPKKSIFIGEYDLKTDL